VGRFAAIVAAGVVLGLLALIDVATGPDVGLSLFYVLPVCVIAWSMGRAAAALVAACAAGCWLAADVALARYAVAISVWNALSRLVMYEAIGVGLAMLRRDRERLTALARTDGLTGLDNARFFQERLASGLPIAQRRSAPTCVAFIDLDNFKLVNDRFGHSAGDALLVEIGRSIRSTVRSSDLVGRLGGDEFAVVLWDADATSAVTTAQRLLDAIAAFAARYPGTGVGATVGLAAFRGAPGSADEALRLADEAMYAAKVAGKGQIVLRQHPAAVA
jgi:diguanylate cyclase (GGDEF)-like protein